MTVIGLLWVGAVVTAAAAVVAEVRASRRRLRPARVGVLAGAALLVTAVSVTALLSDGSPLGVLGLPRRYATYTPTTAFNWWLLVPALGIGLLIGAGIGTVRSNTGLIDDRLPAARTRNRVAATAGLVLVVVGCAAVLVSR